VVAAGIGQTDPGRDHRGRAELAGCDRIATFDEAFVSPTVPVRLI